MNKIYAANFNTHSRMGVIQLAVFSLKVNVFQYALPYGSDSSNTTEAEYANFNTHSRMGVIPKKL